jgi:DNA repair ATPase RecN
MLQAFHKMVSRLYQVGRSSPDWKDGKSQLVEQLYRKIETMDIEMSAYYESRRKQLEELVASIDYCTEKMMEKEQEICQLSSAPDGSRQLRTLRREYGRQAGELSKYQADYNRVLDELIADGRMLEEFRGGKNGK